MDPELVAPIPIAELIKRAGIRLALICERCDHARQVDMPAVIDRYGAAITVRDLVRRGRCTRCGARQVGVRLGHDGHPSWVPR